MDKDEKKNLDDLMYGFERLIVESTSRTEKDKEEFFREHDLSFIKQYQPLSNYYDEEWDRALEESNRELNQWIDSNPYLATQAEEEREDFGKALLLCGRLALFGEAELTIFINRKENLISVILLAPDFLFSPRQLLVLQQISMVTSEIMIDHVGFEEKESLMEFRFYFPKPNHLLSQIKRKIL